MTAFDLFFILAGPFVGSFIALLAFRWADGDNWVNKRSQCRSCGATLGWKDLIPVFSWLVQRGKCRHCSAQVTPFYPACELLALLIPISAFFFAPDGTFVLSCLMGWTLLALAAIDWRSYILPDPLNLLLAALGLVMVFTVDRDNWADHLIGGAAGYLMLLSVEILYRVWRGRDGLGRGDAKLLGALGLWVGWIALPDILLFASLSGLVFALASSLSNRSALSGQTVLAFGPWLAFAGWVSWLAGPVLVQI